MNWIFLSFGVGAQIIGSATEKSVGLISINTHELILICKWFSVRSKCTMCYLLPSQLSHASATLRWRPQAPQLRFGGCCLSLGSDASRHGLEWLSPPSAAWGVSRRVHSASVGLGVASSWWSRRFGRLVCCSCLGGGCLLFRLFLCCCCGGGGGCCCSLLWITAALGSLDHRCIDGPTSSVVELGLALRWLPWRVAACLFWAEGVHLEKNCWKKDMWADMLR